MLIINGKGKTKIDINIKTAITHSEQAKGLMFESKKRFNYALIFEFKTKNRFLNSIHMFFVFFPICAIFLDTKKKVVDKKILKPFCLIYVPKRNCKYLIEMPKEFEKKIKVGDKISWN